MYLVEQPGLDALLDYAGDSHRDVLVPRNFPRLLDGAFNAVRDEHERRFFVDLFLVGPYG